MYKNCLPPAILAQICAGAVLFASGPEKHGPDAAQVLGELIAGNQRFAAGAAQHPNQTRVRLVRVAKAQHPAAAVLTCSDSRVPPEILFDCGVGDLFVMRVAGNIADDAVLGSIEYAVEHLGVKVVMVLGHRRCGAISAAAAGGEAPGHIRSLVEALLPSVAAARSRPGDMVDHAVHIHAESVAAKISASEPILSHAVHAGHTRVVAAYYDLDTGKVTVLR